MEGGIQNSLDALAANGVINFDADAFVSGASPRYVGSLPQNYLPFDRPLGNYPTAPALLPNGTKIKGQPKKDEMVTTPDGKQEKKTQTWQKVCLGILGAAVLTFGGTKLYNLIKAGKKPVHIQNNNSNSVINNIQTTCSNVCKKIKGLFHKKP
jgi:hypothetical protein